MSAKKESLNLIILLICIQMSFSVLIPSISGNISGLQLSPFSLLPQASPVLSFHSYTVNDDTTGSSFGDNDALADAGETIELRISLENTGDQDATNVNATLSSTDSFVSISVSYQDFVLIGSGSVGISSSFYVLTLNSSCPSSYTILFTLVINATEGSWVDTFNMTVIGTANPEFSRYDVTVENDADLTADGDGIIDAGEEVTFLLHLLNNGGASMFGVTGTLSTSDIFASITDASGSFGDIDSFDMASDSFTIIVSGSCSDKHTINFDLDLTDSFGTVWVLSLDLVVNGTTSYSVSVDFNEYTGDSDDHMDVGEEWYVSIAAKNIGDALGSSTYLFFTSNDPYVDFTVSEPSRKRYLGDLSVGESNSRSEPYYWRFTILGSCPAGRNISFTVEITDDTTADPFIFSTSQIAVNSTAFSLASLDFFEYTGDGDANLDVWEYWYVGISVQNIGGANAHDVEIFFTSDDIYIEFEAGESYRSHSLGDLAVGESSSFVTQSYYWRFAILGTTPKNHLLDFTVEVSDTTGIVWSFNQSQIVIGVPEYELQNITFTEEYGDGDNFLDVGEDWYLSVDIKNIGGSGIKELAISVSSNDPHVDFYYYSESSRTIYEYDIEENETRTIDGYYDWEFEIVGFIRSGHELSLTLNLVDDSLNTISFPIVAIVTVGSIQSFFSSWIVYAIGIGTIAFIGFLVYQNRGTIKKKLKKRKKKTQKQRKKKAKSRTKKPLKDLTEGISSRREARRAEQAKKRAEKEARKQQEERDRLAIIRKNEQELLEKFQDILSMTNKVSIEVTAKSLGLKESQLFEKLLEWNEDLDFKIDGRMIVVDDEDTFNESMQKHIDTIAKQYTCSYCGYPIERTTEICPDCHKEVLSCVVCKLPISFGDEQGQCSLCEVKGHLVHLQEWTKVHGKCPYCLQKIPVDGIIPLSSLSAKKKK